MNIVQKIKSQTEKIDKEEVKFQAKLLMQSFAIGAASALAGLAVSYAVESIVTHVREGNSDDTLELQGGSDE